MHVKQQPTNSSQTLSINIYFYDISTVEPLRLSDNPQKVTKNRSVNNVRSYPGHTEGTLESLRQGVTKIITFHTTSTNKERLIYS